MYRRHEDGQWRDQRSHHELKSWASTLRHLEVKSSAKVAAMGDNTNRLHLRGALMRQTIIHFVFLFNNKSFI